MPTKISILLLSASALFFLPGMASASDVDVRSGNVRTIIDRDGGIFIRTGRETIRVGGSYSPSSYRHFRRKSASRHYRSNCHTDSHSYSSDLSSGYSDGTVRSYSSTTVCQ